MRLIAAILIVAITPTLAFTETSVIDHLQSIGVTIKSGTSSGSGVLFSRKVGDEVRSYCWTAGHCLDDLRKTREVIVKGNPKTVVEFGDAAIVSEFYQGGRRIGEMKLDAKVIRYSDADNGEDLGLLEIRKRNFVPEETSVVFHEGDTPSIGSELYHVGSLLGDLGANSLTQGALSKVGRVLDLGANGKVFDQCAVGAFPGSSGGGVYLKENGQCIGLLVRGAGETFSFIVPVRRMREWAQEAGVEWAMDRKVEMPSARELARMPIEDTPGPAYSEDREPTPAELEFPTLIRKEAK